MRACIVPVCCAVLLLSGVAVLSQSIGSRVEELGPLAHMVGGGLYECEAQFRSCEDAINQKNCVNDTLSCSTTLSCAPSNQCTSGACDDPKQVRICVPAPGDTCTSSQIDCGNAPGGSCNLTKTTFTASPHCAGSMLRTCTYSNTCVAAPTMIECKLTACGVG